MTTSVARATPHANPDAPPARRRNRFPTAETRAANARWQRRRRAAINAGTWQPHEDPSHALAQIERLKSYGLSLEAIAEASGVSASTVKRIHARRFKYVDRGTADRIAATRLDYTTLPAGRLIDSAGTIRRLRALAVNGWTTGDIAERLGCSRANVGKLLTPRHGAERVTVGVAARIAAMYDDLSLKRGPSAITARRAAAAGWAPALAWDDDTIDDPAARPDLGDSRFRDRDATAEDAEFLAADGADWDEACARIGKNGEALDRALRRAGRPDLIGALRRNGDLANIRTSRSPRAHASRRGAA